MVKHNGMKILWLRSGQDGGVGRNPLLPRTTKRRKTTSLKSVNSHKCQKIKLHGTPTTMELKKQSKRTTRPIKQPTDRNCGEAEKGEGGPAVEQQQAVLEGLT